ncbi:hypothetical protein [Arenimonas terrae]|uniref:hypothetical protein n=1 Tax=Arenimonas terrae TaxID=2546226 RepID=UPI001C7055FB|nr:hypothetical protein [Arenimonas terrae]
MPALLAAAWTSFNLYTAPEKWNFKVLVNVFGPSFFLASWATGQFFRVKKQALVEKNLSAIEQRVEGVLSRIEQQARDFAGYTTGTDGFASFEPMIREKGFIELGLINLSTYPVFDVQAEVIDLDEAIDPDKGKLWTRHLFHAQSLYPSKAIMSAYRFDMRGRQRLRINIFIFTRSGGATQQLRVDNSGDWPLIAVRTMNGDQVVELKVPEAFPGYDPQNPAALFS